MPEPIANYTMRQVQKYDTNRDGMIEPNPIPFLVPVGEGGTGRAHDYFVRNATISFGGMGAVLPQTLEYAVYRDIDTNHDQQISLGERINGFFKYGLW